MNLQSFLAAKFGAVQILTFMRNKHYDLNARTTPGQRNCLHRALCSARLDLVRIIWK